MNSLNRNVNTKWSELTKHESILNIYNLQHKEYYIKDTLSCFMNSLNRNFNINRVNSQT
jgi:hypothetical protein